MQPEDDRREIRCAIRSDKPDQKNPILNSTRSRQKRHLVSRDSVGIEFGQYVTAELVRDLERCAIYHCKPIGGDRMVARSIIANDMSETFIDRQDKQEIYWGSHHERIRDFAELITYSVHDEELPFTGQIQEWLLLIRSEEEGDVLEALAKYYNDTVVIQFCPCGHVSRMTEEQMKALGLDTEKGTFHSSDCPQCKADQEERNQRVVY